MEQKKSVHAVVSGRVQGVFYRASTRDEAVRLGLKGWVRNLPDGRVELVAEGRSGAVDALISWCWKGPAYAKVDNIDMEEGEFTDGFDDFEVRY